MLLVNFVKFGLLHTSYHTVSVRHGTLHGLVNRGGEVLDVLELCGIVGGVEHSLQQCSTSQNAHCNDTTPPW